MDRSNDIVIPAKTGFLNDPEAQRVCRVITDAGYDVYFVGGCVRDAVLGKPDSDVDISTNALPEQVMSLAEAAGLKAVPTGIDHGTVTVIAGKDAFEVTTFRRDVATDGRRAVVAFSDNIADDARRRDFTMNALYSDPSGRIIDPLGGLTDLLARKVRFIEDANARIQEDYLRILRFFRFSAWYSNQLTGFDPDALAAIAANTGGLETLSAERVGQEMTKLLSAPNPAPAIAAMRQTGVLSAILPGSDDQWLSIVVHLEQHLRLDADWVARLAALGGQDAAARLRLSKANARKLELLRDIGFSGPPLPEIAYRHGADIAGQALLLRAAMAEDTPEIALLETIKRASQAVFPIRAADLMPTFEGPALGARLDLLEREWIASGFTLSGVQLLDLP
ncbi:CCA tRNA nucleotidyltransferase [Sulfitobacter sp. MF3-043]|uniref:CCA tRNA nucleotidyltransferase n=1 Tax=Sulfitobacter sediminivivens TaxID=3252902 RepID=UPI0036DE5C0A